MAFTGGPNLMDPHHSQQQAGLHHAVRKYPGLKEGLNLLCPRGLAVSSFLLPKASRLSKWDERINVFSKKIEVT